MLGPRIHGFAQFSFTSHSLFSEIECQSSSKHNFLLLLSLYLVRLNVNPQATIKFNSSQLSNNVHYANGDA